MLKDAQMSMKEIARFLLSGNNVTEVAAETSPSEEMISVTEIALEIPEKRKRGRPPKADGAMTAAERARQYRQKHRPAWQDRRVDLLASTVELAEKIAAERGSTVASVIDQAVCERSVVLWEGLFERAEASAATAGESVSFMVNSALLDISNTQWNEMTQLWIRYKAERAAKAQSDAADAA